MMPGMTTRPSASTVRRAPERRPMSVTRPSRMPTSARRMGRPEPSTTVPPLMMVSNALIDILRSRSRRPPDVLELAVGPERPVATDAADTGELVAAERGVGVERAAVDLDRAGPHGARDAQPARGVAGPDVAVEPVVGVVGERDRLGLVAEGDRGDHRPEDLLARDRHVVARAGEERRLHVVAPGEVRRAAAAAGDRRPLLAAAGDEAFDARALGRRDERADDDAGLPRVADPERRARRGQTARERVVKRLLDQHARAGDADLPGVEGPDAHRARERALEVAVGEDDVGRLAAELEHGPLHARGRRLLDAPADGRAAREGDHG